MRFLYIGYSDVFSRHELGFVAALSGFGKLDVVVLGGEGRIRRLSIASDSGVHIVIFYEIPCNNLARVYLCTDIISSLLNINDYDAVFATPRLPLLTARRLNAPMRVILRLWSIRAAKLKDNLRFGAYEDTLIFIPSTIANAYYILNSTYSIAVDHVAYTFAKKFYPLLKSRIAKVYPPYGYILGENEVHQEVPEIIDRGNYILGFAILGKRGSYLKFEAKPHAIVLYLLAKRAGMDVVLAGSNYGDWKHVFPGLEPPRNLHIVGKGFPDNIVAKMYKNASWLYVGKVPHFTYRPPTTSDITLAEDLLKLSVLGELGIFRIYQDFDPGVYLVRLLEWGLIEPNNTLLPAIDVQSISILGDVNDDKVVFNSRSLYILRGGQ